MEANKRRYVLIYDPNLSRGPAGPAGPAGPGTPVNLPIDTNDVLYRGDVLTGVIDNILYLPLTIASFTASPAVYELGVILSSIQLSWSFNKAVVSQSITGVNVVPPTLVTSDRASLVTLSSISANTTIFLTADDVTGDPNAAKVTSLSIAFVNRIYYGKRTDAAINNAFLLSLSSDLVGVRNKSFTVSTGVSEFIYYACPVSYGVPTIKTNGFSGGLDLVSTFAFTNASGFTENYSVFKSPNDNVGSTLIDIT